MKRFRLWACAHIPGVHPGMERLILRADGAQSPEVEAHLAGCRRCQIKAEFFRSAVEAANQYDSTATVVLEETWRNLQLQMRAWCLLGGLTARQKRRDRGSHTSRLSEAVEFYFGKEAARRIETGARWDAADCASIPMTKPLFSAFLGRKAAEALTHRISSATT